MIKFNARANVSVEDFFHNYMPKQLKALIAQAGSDVMKKRDFSLQFKVGQNIYCLKIKDGVDVETVKGGIEKPTITVFLNEASWRDIATDKVEGVLDPFIDPTRIANQAHYEKVRTTKGTLNLELSEADAKADKVCTTVVFSGEAKPAVTMKLSRANWVAMRKRETTGQALFMSGKMKASGDMSFLMGLQPLI
jgi:putative sterol carrier protein